MITDLAANLTPVVRTCVVIWALTSSASAQTTLRIISPVDGEVVRPGQMITVEVVAAGETPTGVFVIGQLPIGGSRGPIEVPPYNFIMEIPKEIKSGTYNLTAAGYSALRHDVKEDIVTIDVERADSPVSLRAEDLSYIRVHVGQTMPCRIAGTFSDGTKADLVNSTLTTFRSDNISVATVGPYGAVTGVAPGSTKLIVTNGNARLEIPMTVLRDNEE
jgi:hypothetical protein